jgi:hypothetical protein
MPGWKAYASSMMAPLAEAKANVASGGKRGAGGARRLADWWRSAHAKRIEAVGTFLILAAVLWEAFTLRHADDVVSQLVTNELDVQLKFIVAALGSENPRDYVLQYQNQFIDATSVIPNIEDIKALNLVGYYSRVRMTVFVIGSFLVVVAKWREGRPKA